MATQTEANDEAKHDGFNVVAELTPMEWVDFGYDHHGEYIHLFANKEERELTCYRSVSDPGVDNERIVTTISDVSFRYFFDEEEGDINYWYLTYMEAMTFMSFVELMEGTREGRLSFDWSESDGGTMMDDEKTSIEAITLTFTKENGVERSVQIRSEWQSPKSHRMASIEGEAY
jgi:hypothetical protein